MVEASCASKCTLVENVTSSPIEIKKQCDGSKKDNLFLCVVNDFYDEKLLNKIKNRNVKIVKLNRKVGGKKTAGMKKLRNIVKKEKIDVVHCHSVNVLNYAFLALGYSFKRKYILTIHNVSIYGTLSHH